jgi:hypothetical protein
MIASGGNAIVLGASMAGLLAARVLADFYQSVIVVERDVLPYGMANRRGVPQGRHPHVLMARAPQILEELFPACMHELVESGCVAWRDADLSKLHLAFGGHRRTPLFLDDLGYGRPAEDEVFIQLTYASMPVHIAPGSMHQNHFAILPKPGDPTGLVMFECENGTWMVGVCGMCSAGSTQSSG